MDALAALRRLGQGKLLEDLHAQIVAASAEVVETGQPATITLTLRISNSGVGDNLVRIVEGLKRTTPKRPARGAMFYTRDGELFKDDPDQLSLDELRVVDQETGEIRQPRGGEREERSV